ncbi:restriction endonuclease [Shewanella oncorhynchi]|uniref:restriction endonuclease n=1 Tax=Shewanella oncorhynchi TaxID=2726434 RepID=UPI003D7959E1
MDWKDYQEEAAEFFRSLGLEAETDVTIQGARTKHDIDVLVKSHHAGFDIVWLVECKHWKSKVSKLHVLGLREIVNDTGADRGIILAENGFQSGAIEAAALTNVHVTSLAEAANTASHEIHSMRLRELYDKLLWCKEEYWGIPKSMRIECGLRPDVGDIGYSGDWVIKAGEDLITKGLRGSYPISTDEIHLMISQSIIEKKLPNTIRNIQELLILAEPLISNLEQKINVCKAKA